MAEDIDIFLGRSGGVAAAPHVMIMIDNTTSWYDDSPATTSKFDALSVTLDAPLFSTPMDVGLAIYTKAGTQGAQIRFAPRDMSIAANRTALKNIIAHIKGTSNTNAEIHANRKVEGAMFYEIYKYFSGLLPYSGGSVANNPYIDQAGNLGPTPATTANPAGGTAFSQALTSGFALAAGAGNTYNTTASTCGKNYIIYIVANNTTGSYGVTTYETTNAGTLIPPNAADTWTHFLYTHKNPQISTYVLDAYYPVSNQDATYSNNLIAMAKQGGGSYFHVTGQITAGVNDITVALLKIFEEIQAVNTTFASASLPVNTTNRAQDKNQVFIPMFRPDAADRPLWMGNLKQYQLMLTSGDVVLGDSTMLAAVNPTTGFVTACATSFWTTDSPVVIAGVTTGYWANVPENPSPAGTCNSTSFNAFSDAPDGPFVEKGGVAEVIRKGNNPPTTNATPTWAVNRTIYTQPLAGGALTTNITSAAFALSSGLAPPLANFIFGQDVNDENTNCPVGAAATHSCFTETRPSLHGDAIHSRPLPIDYGGTTGVTVYYGSNDGTLRAVDSTSGRERWAFVAPEFYPTLNRLLLNSPIIKNPGTSPLFTPTPTPKDYYFDGSLGIFEDLGNATVSIYPTMRRGGRVIYAFNVTNPASPTFKWKAGCPNLANDTGCTTGFTGIGQTWSVPRITPSILGYTGPVMVVGGGYDGCEDADTKTPSCATPKGAGVYVIDANTGALIKSFSTTRSVPADVSLLAFTTAGVVDHAYAVDTGGNIYRIDFVASGPSNWTIKQVAHTNTTSGRKFFYPPALLPAPGNKVYLAIGTGDREHPLQSQYPYAGVTNRFYVYVDDLSASAAVVDLDDATSMKNFTGATTCTTAGVLPTSAEKGWFMDLNQSGVGEQTVTSAVIASGLVAFSTNRPIPTASGTCATTLGEARGYFVNLFNASGAVDVAGSCEGLRSGTFVAGGLPPSPVIGTVPIGGKPYTVVIGAIQRQGGASGTFSPQEIKPIAVPNRKTIYWKSSGED